MTRPSLPERLAAGEVLHLPCAVTHARRGRLTHAFRYGVDYILLAPDQARPPRLLARNQLGLMALHDIDHGGPRGAGEGSAWAWRQFAQAGVPREPDHVLALLTQPRLLGFWFTPVAFWLLFRRDGALLAAIAEVNNTFGQRHSYLCLKPDREPISPADTVAAAKVFHVSPFQDVAGSYRFRLNVGSDRLAIAIAQLDGPRGLHAAMTAVPRPLTNAGLLAASLRRPGGALRVLALIYWNALRLRLKGARYRPLPPPPDQELSR